MHAGKAKQYRHVVKAEQPDRDLLTETMQAIETIGHGLATLDTQDLQQVMPTAINLAQDILRRDQSRDELPTSLRKFLAEVVRDGSNGQEFDRRVSAWANEPGNGGPPPAAVSIDDVRRALAETGTITRPSETGQPRLLTDTEAQQIISEFMGNSP